MTPAQKIATLLDVERPGWHNEVDTGSLDMDDCQNCLLGQLYDSYTVGRMTLGVSRDEAPYYGIVVPDAVLDGPGESDALEALFERQNVALRDNIVKEIEDRRAADRRGVESVKAEQRSMELTYA